MLRSILVIDSQPLRRSGVKAALAAMPEMPSVSEAAELQEGLSNVQHIRPDIILVEFSPAQGAREIKLIKERAPRVRIILMAERVDDETAVACLRAGASGVVSLGCETHELAKAIQAVSRGEAWASRRVISKALSLTRGGDGAARLTKREKQVLRLLALGRSNAEIADELFVSEKTVKTHVSSVLGKLHVRDRLQAALKALREGLVEDSVPIAPTEEGTPAEGVVAQKDKGD